jgi:hypothetical protein
VVLLSAVTEAPMATTRASNTIAKPNTRFIAYSFFRYAKLPLHASSAFCQDISCLNGWTKLSLKL